MDNCIFCMIINNDIPAQKIYEDENFLAFLDINPINYGHTLVIPKAHYANLLELPSELGSSLIDVTKKVAQAVIKGTNASGFNLLQNNNKVAGQEVFHFHLHIIPRFENDGHKIWTQKKYDTQEHMLETANAIQKSLEDCV